MLILHLYKPKKPSEKKTVELPKENWYSMNGEDKARILKMVQRHEGYAIESWTDPDFVSTRITADGMINLDSHGTSHITRKQGKVISIDESDDYPPIQLTLEDLEFLIQKLK